MSGVAFVDCETTGLDPDRHEVWEVGLIVDDLTFRWVLPVDLGRADPVALRIGGYHDRTQLPVCIRNESDVVWHDDEVVDPLGRFAHDFAALTRGRHLIGAVVSFDAERLAKLLKANGACPEWHYHLIDVEAMAVGFLAGGGYEVQLPWDSAELSRQVGVNPDEYAKHTALGDARWAKAIYDAITGVPYNGWSQERPGATIPAKS